MPPFDCKDENSFGFSLFVHVKFKLCSVLLTWIKHSLLFRNTVEPPLTTTSTQRASTATPLQWSFFSWRTVHTLNLVSTSLQRPLLYNGNFFWRTVHTLNLVSTSLQRPLLYNGHFFFLGGQSINSLLCQPLYNGHLSTMATLLHRYWWDTRIFPYTKKIISSSRAVKILFLSFTCEDIGVAVVTNIDCDFLDQKIFIKYYCIYFSFITLYPSFRTFCDRWPL